MPSDSSKAASPSPFNGTRVGTGRSILPGVDGRSAGARRYREIVHQLESDAGGDPSGAQQAIIRRAATLAVWCEQAEGEFANGAELDIQAFTTATNALRRLLADLGLERKARDITPSLEQYIRAKAGGAS